MRRNQAAAVKACLVSVLALCLSGLTSAKEIKLEFWQQQFELRVNDYYSNK